ncbi:MAG TPA: hypothetical protein VK126_03640 [Nitrososphaerales archaeon]|nr:hypothetical protein [Nitrososphaerales archaeon]
MQSVITYDEGPVIPGTTMKATIVTYPDEFAKREIQELAKAGGYSVEAVITQKQVIKSGYGVGWARRRSSLSL